ncbi:hypothetical protein JQ582_30275 [Bradyrhizobium japonicum]|uniref:hypothetical protein n=1 Tax=Bradyrhizobium japonicum TaxID=375 RepID=UPI001BAA132A|nr:hypothetical protein [Bradyrhizobium japonicum]MBR0748227.1 hypothetical protein [Bradyrhizobium japonicum]
MTIDPASLAANSSTTIGTVTINPAAVGDQVKVEMGVDTGLLVTGYVGAANTVTIRLTNPTSGPVDLGSTISLCACGRNTGVPHIASAGIGFRQCSQR